MMCPTLHSQLALGVNAAFLFSSRRRHTRSVSAFLLNRSSDLNIMVTLHEVITFLVSMQISISSLQTHNVNRCGRSRHLARKLSLRRKRSSPRSEERFSRNAETDLVCRLLLEKKKETCCQRLWLA